MTKPHATPRINLQGNLANPNLALDAARAGTLDQLPKGPTGRVDHRALADARASGLSALGVTLGHVVGPADDAWASTCADVAAWCDFANRHAGELRIARCVDDVNMAQRNGQLALLLGIQNTVMLGGDAPTVRERIQALSAQGVGVMQLTYNGVNALGHGCLSTGGLTELGFEAVATMNACRVLIDLSHANAQTLRDAVGASTGLVIVSHTGCRDLVDNPRNTWDADMRLVADRGGIVGIYCMPYLREQGQPMLDDWVRHIEHAWHVVGHGHVAIGTDGTLTAVDDLALYLHHVQEAARARREAGVGAPGEEQAVALFLPDAAGPTQLERLADRLLARGHPASAVDALLGGNARRLLGDVWG